jgi:predicted phage terminase large subunit-like protein
MLLTRPEVEVFYGGAVGGGKSDALLMAALQFVNYPDYAGIIFRRTYTDLALAGALMSRSKEWLNDSDAHWSELDKTWTFPSGASLTFAYLKTENDKYRYRSAEFQFIAFDELTDFTESQYTYMMSRLRRKQDSKIPLRCRSASNPDGPGAEWVQQRFVPLNDQGEYDPSQAIRGRKFIPAGLDDNPHLDKAAYEESLKQLDVVTRQQLREGRWDVRRLGGMLDRTMFDLYDSSDLPDFTDTVRAWDLAGTKPSSAYPDPDWTRGVLLGFYNGATFILDIVSCREEPGGVRALVSNTAARDGTDVRVILPKDPGAAGKDSIHSYAKMLRGYTVNAVPVTKNKVLMARPWAADAGNGLVKVVRGAWNRAFFAEVEGFPQKGLHDDIVDAVSYGHKVLGRRVWRAR